MTDAELIVASRRDPRAFRELYDRWADKLLAYFYRRVLDAEVAADLLAETFAVAYERRRRFRDVGRPGGAWLYGIAAKELSHWFRRQEVEQHVRDVLAPAGVPIRFTLGRMPPNQGTEPPRGDRYAEGCAIYVGAHPSFPGGQTEIVVALRQREAAG